MLWKFSFCLYLAAAVVVVGAPVEAAQADQDRPAAEAALALDEPMPAGTRQWDVLAEVVKQAAEQPLHFAMSASPIWLSRCLTAVPWYGWAVIPALAYREWRQWPSQRWWDPPLDAAFLVLGVVVATWSGKALPGPSPLTAMRRRDWRSTLLRRVPAMTHRPLPAEHPFS